MSKNFYFDCEKGVFNSKIQGNMKKDKQQEKFWNEVASWQDVPIGVEGITPEICAICPLGDTQCPKWLNTMGLGSYCYESYKKYHKENK